MASNTSFTEATNIEGRSVNATNYILDHWWIALLLLFVLWLARKLWKQQRLLAHLDERADAAFGDVDALLVERRALLQNLSTTVKSFATMEKGVINDVLMSRVDALEALDGGILSANTQIGGALQNLFSLSEQYPTLASDRHYRDLRADIIRIEEKITAARKYYNLAVEEMNSVRRTFPIGMIAGVMGVKSRDKFTLGDRRDEFAEPIAIEL